jgi:hypothetical protein
MIKIESPRDLPANVPLQMWSVDDEAEAAKIAGNTPAYLYKSQIIEQLYLFVLVNEQSLTKM